MAHRTRTSPGKTNAEHRSHILRKVMEILALKGYAKVSMADIENIAGVGRSALHDTFGSREDILRDAIHFCADTEASLADEPLRVSATGREAISAMLEENVRLHRYWPRNFGCLFTINPFVIPPAEADLRDFLSDRRRSLAKQIRSRLVRSVSEKELTEDTNCEALANLCLAVLSGLTIRILDGTSPALIFRSIEAFINGIGFNAAQAATQPRALRPRKAKQEAKP
jgi:AcrR family transcriptional regulator